MTIYVAEYGGYASGRQLSPGIVSEPAINVQVITAAGTAAQTTSTLSAGTRQVEISADAGSWFAFGSSTSSTANTFSSTNSQHISAGQRIVRNVSPSARLIACST